MSATTCWNKLKKSPPKNPQEFMTCVHSIIPNINEHNIAAWQRTCEVNNCELQIFDFLWFYVQLEQGHLEYYDLVQKAWPNIKKIIEEKSLEELFASMGL